MVLNELDAGVEVGLVELVRDVPTQGSVLSSLLDDAVEKSHRVEHGLPLHHVTDVQQVLVNAWNRTQQSPRSDNRTFFLQRPLSVETTSVTPCIGKFTGITLNLHLTLKKKSYSYKSDVLIEIQLFKLIFIFFTAPIGAPPPTLGTVALFKNISLFVKSGLFLFY